MTATLQICATNTLGVQVRTIHFALPQTSKPVEQEARHLFPPRLSCFQQVGDCCLPSMDVTRLTPNDEEECAAEHVHHQHDSDTELTGTFDTRGQTKCETLSLWKHIIALSVGVTVSVVPLPRSSPHPPRASHRVNGARSGTRIGVLAASCGQREVFASRSLQSSSQPTRAQRHEPKQRNLSNASHASCENPYAEVRSM